jgi:hypothetical protein
MLDTATLQRNSVSFCRSAVVQNRQQIFKFASTGHGAPTQSGDLGCGVSAGADFACGRGRPGRRLNQQQGKWFLRAKAVVDSVLLLPCPASPPAQFNPEPSYPPWKADAVKPLQKLHERAVRSTRDGFWTRCYVRNLSPEKAAELAAREYDAMHPPNWIKRRR